jgi:hypothetical protein
VFYLSFTLRYAVASTASGNTPAWVFCCALPLDHDFVISLDKKQNFDHFDKNR